LISIIPTSIAKKVLVSVLLIFCLDTQAAAVSEQQQLLLNLTQKLYLKGDKKQALQQLELAIKKVDKNQLAARPFLYQSHLLLAKLLAKSAEYSRQLQVLQKVKALLIAWQLGQSVDVVTVQQNIAQVLLQLGQEDKAIDAFKQSLQLARQIFSAEDLRISNILLSLAKVHINRLQVEISEAYLSEIEQNLDGRTGQPVELMRGRLLQAKGLLVFRQAKTRHAAELYRQALKQREQTLGAEHIETAQTISSLAGAVKGLHEFSEADELYRRAFAIYEKALGYDHPFIATLLNNMGQLYYLEGRYQESEKVLLRAIAIKKQQLGEEHPLLADSYNHLGYLYFLLERDQLALDFFSKAIKIWSSPLFLRPRYIASAEIWVAVIHHRQGHSEKALQELQQVLVKLEDIYGKQTVSTTQVYHEMAKILKTLGKNKQAEQAYIQGLERAGAFGQSDRLGQILMHSDLAVLYASNDDYVKALNQARESIEGLKLRVMRHSGLRAHGLNTELKSLRRVVINHIDILYEIMQKTKGCTPSMFDFSDECPDYQALLDESFSSAQIAKATSTARALSQVSQRFSINQGDLAEKVRQRQDLIDNWQEIDNLLSSVIFSSAKKRDFESEQKLVQRSHKLKQQIQQLDEEIKNTHPGYLDLIQSPPLTIQQVQTNLLDKQALIVYLIGKKKSYLWVVTKEEAAIYPLDINEQQIDESVRQLRHVLDPTNLEGSYTIPAIPVDKAYHLYQQILAPAEKILQSIKHLIIVSDKALQSLPLSVLVTKKVQGKIKTPEGHLKVDWLINSKAISSLPAVSSLKVLRKAELQKSKVESPFLGIGDPALAKSEEYFTLRNKGKNAIPNLLRSIVGASRSIVAVDVLSRMAELPETADELKQVSDILGGSKQDLYLRDKATETIVKSLPLNKYNVVHFATHGLMAGDFQGLFEPALVMTLSPNVLDFDDNGLLTTSEITQLNFNANMVVLSACNTAANDGSPGAEGLSGLARAFFYAGGRALFVSNWAVASDATVDITIGMFRHKKTQASIGMAEAHRLSILDLMKDKERPHFAHPMFWAPFVIVGLGD